MPLKRHFRILRRNRKRLQVKLTQKKGLSVKDLNVSHCTARQSSPLRRKFMECCINNPVLSLLMKHLVIGQRLKPLNFSAFHWSPHGSLVSIGQHFVATRVVHLPKSTETSLVTESDQSRPNHQLLQLQPVSQLGGKISWDSLPPGGKLSRGAR